MQRNTLKQTMPYFGQQHQPFGFEDRSSGLFKVKWDRPLWSTLSAAHAYSRLWTLFHLCNVKHILKCNCLCL